ncbi:mucin-13b [Girardinichthys multiradiatus]|uniref:mucin-13b n=1 Tax=Girardinichthys multiradiatus TaxID=208333 RepID=UPI001FABB779|nr:mucin-13b [Girardinichthys multiradiatus]
MAKILIFTFILWAAVATIATTSDATASTTPTPEPTPAATVLTTLNPEPTTPAATALTTPTPEPTPAATASTTPTPEPTPAATVLTTLNPEPTTPAATALTTPTPEPTPAATVLTTLNPEPTTPAATALTTPTPEPTPAATVLTTLNPEPTTPAATALTTPTPEPTTPAATASTTPNTGTTSLAPATTPVLTTNVPPTGTLPTEGSSVSPETGSPPTKDPATTVPPSACASNPCQGGSTCEERANQTFACLCLTGDVFIGSCVRAKIFPGKLSLKETFKPEMGNKQSQEFKDTSEKITTAIDQKFQENYLYSGSSVLELQGSKSSKTRAEAGNIEASIEIIYQPNANITEDDVKITMKTITCEDCSLPGTFAAQNLCDYAPCDDKTTMCKSTEGTFTCSCKEGFRATNFSERICVECPDGQRYDKNQNKCVSCGFGYTGFNCKDNRVLILVIIAPILGALLIIALILLGVLTTKSKKKSSKIEDEDIGKPYHSHSVAKAPLSKSDSNGYPPPVKELTNGLAVSSGAPRIPRATATGNWESRTNLEMTPNNSRQNLISSGQNSRFDDNQDDMISFAHSRPKNNPYEQIRPTSNPYAQNRSMNPYSQSRGQTNPYYS